jgi:hypothetical protein
MMATPNPLDGVQEIRELVVGYARQETVEPLKRLGTYLAWGFAGALMLFIGTMFVSVGTLRLGQSLDGLAGSSWASLVPYGMAFGVLLLVAIVLFLALRRAKEEVYS